MRDSVRAAETPFPRRRQASRAGGPVRRRHADRYHRSPGIALMLCRRRRPLWTEPEEIAMSGCHPFAGQRTVRDRVFSLFRAFGTKTIFGNPGSTELPMFRDFPADFRYVLALQEAVAVGMADGYAQATRNAAVVNLHSAAGLGHALGAVFTAAKNQAPL